MSAYQRILTLAARDYLHMLGDLLRLQSSLSFEADVFLCVDDDGTDVGWSIMLAANDHEYWKDRICGSHVLSVDSDLRAVLDSLLNQCLGKVAGTP